MFILLTVSPFPLLTAATRSVRRGVFRWNVTSVQTLCRYKQTWISCIHSVIQDLDVEGDGMQGPPSPLQFDTALALEDQTIRAIAEAPMDILTGEHLDASGQDLSERDVDAIMANQVISPLFE